MYKSFGDDILYISRNKYRNTAFKLKRIDNNPNNKYSVLLIHGEIYLVGRSIIDGGLKKYYAKGSYKNLKRCKHYDAKNRQWEDKIISIQTKLK